MSEELPVFPISQEEFEEWLKQKPYYAKVGVTNKPASCPVHIFLREAKGLDVGVGRTFAVGDGGQYLGELPDWVTTFSAALDGDMPEMVTAGHCLEVLGRMYDEEEEE